MLTEKMRAFIEQKKYKTGLFGYVKPVDVAVSERILSYTGKFRELGTVCEASLVMDWTAQEQERGIMIVSPSINTERQKPCINIVDTPAQNEFIESTAFNKSPV